VLDEDEMTDELSKARSDEVDDIFAQLEGIRQTITASERERERLVLKAHAAGLTTRAIGERVGVSSGTISIWIRLARRSGDAA
jgi:DNA-directed RNA polymerase specialized sigma24 family protein